MEGHTYVTVNTIGLLSAVWAGKFSAVLLSEFRSMHSMHSMHPIYSVYVAVPCRKWALFISATFLSLLCNTSVIKQPRKLKTEI